ncbi:esterase B1-like [Culicoides brevitarsis]|uniref:esterase B1-like n=1 Tax=Culicoides brevitarsis TaxID=469753 RepID=UPI00307BBFF0
MTTSIVRTKSGAVKGIAKQTELGKNYVSFQHIPYAQEPTGALRFRDPRPVTPWNDILDCTKEGSPARAFDLFVPDGPKIVGSDNCLGVNIFTPDLHPAKPLPVFVWIHGGGFTLGSSSLMFYGPDYLVEKDVICVSFNYRLGIFGFLSLKDPKVGVPGNAGLKDQTMALRWIKENISYFGGDPDNITVTGESAGGASVHYHMISPLSEGLFHRAISFSGSAFNPWASASQNYPKYLKKLIVQLGLKEDADDKSILEAMNNMDPVKLLELDQKLIDFNDGVLGNELMSIFIPQTEPYVSEMCFLPKSILELGRNPWSKDLDVIFGGTANEGMMQYMLAERNPHLEMFLEDPTLLIKPEIREKLTHEEAVSKGQALKSLYFVNDDLTECFVEYSSERLFWHGIHRAIMQRQVGNGKGRTFVYYLNIEPSVDTPGYYEFCRKLSKIPHMKGMSHGEDLPLYFKTSFAPRFKPGDDIYPAQQAFLTFITDFAKNGKPNGWTPLEKGETKNVKAMEIDQKSHEMRDLKNLHKIRVWDSLYDPKELI